VWFEFGIDSNSNLNKSFNPRSFPLSFEPLLGRPPKKPVAGPAAAPAQQPSRPQQPSNQTLSLFLASLAAGQGPLVNLCFPLPVFSFLLRLHPTTGQSSRIAQGARDGTAAPARRPAHRGIGRARARVEPGPGGECSFTPAPHPCGLARTKEEAAPPRSPGQSKPGQQRDFALPLWRRGSKARGEAEGQPSKPPTPLGFSLSTPPERAP
jgi:hypothetical protein